MRVIIAAGGTGGHIVPALAVAAALEEKRAASRDEILFVGSGKEIENRLVEGAGFKLRQIPSVPFIGKGVRGLLDFFRSLPKTFAMTRQVFDELKPSVVIVFGGYPSIAPALIAKVRAIPVVVQEQNAQAGLANKLIGLFAARIFAVPGATGFWKKSEITFQPNPVRKELGTLSMWRPPAPGEKLRLLVMGGSQGAVKLNTAIIASLPRLKDLGVSIFHQTGTVDLERVTQAYKDANYPWCEVVAFTDRIVEQYERAHLVVARAGAMSVWEISTAGRPAIFVPLRIARAHQSENAKHLVEMGGAVIIEQDPGYEEKVATELQRMFENSDELGRRAAKMREASRVPGASAAEVIADAIVKLGS